MALLPWFRALHIAATVLIGGAFAFDVLILRRARLRARDPAVAGAVDRWLARQRAWGLVIALLSWAGWLAAIAVNMSGLPVSQALAPEVIGTVLAQTAFGHAWSIRLALMLVLGALLLSGARRSGFASLLSAAATVALVGSLAWTGHALGTNHVHVWVDALHLLAAAAWIGMLPLLWLVVAKAVSEPASWRDLGVASARLFFLPGVFAVLVLAGSGVANTSWMIDSVSDLTGTGYGRILSMKLALFALMLMLAVANRFVIVPRVDGGGGLPLRSLRTSVLAELALGAAILAVVAWLGVTPPAAHSHMLHPMGGM